MRTQVAIIGSGPAGLLLAHQLHLAGIDCVVIEQRSRDYVEARIRAGVLERGTVDLVRSIGAAQRMDRDGLLHGGFAISQNGEATRIDLASLTGHRVMVYGQTELTRDLIAAAIARDIPIRFDAQSVALHALDTSRPAVSFRCHGEDQAVDADFIAGCDGFHGVSRGQIPDTVRREFERIYPFGWLGILADVPPCDHELIYASHERGFALASMRSPTRSRYYVQVPADEPIEAWPDTRFWDELAVRLGPAAGANIIRGPALEKSIAPLRSFVSEPMRHGRLFLAGDAAHIVPPTGAKGLNLAVTDTIYLAEALIDFYQAGSSGGIDHYSARALARVWKAERFSWWMTGLTHRFSAVDDFAYRMQLAELSYIFSSEAAQKSLAENYVGLPI